MPTDTNTPHDRTSMLARLDRALDRGSDPLNPLFVKETRQAIKSRQFALFFFLMLFASWIITIGGVLFIGPSIYYVSAGGHLMVAYYGLLAFPLMVVVPFMAYRSLSVEQEANTRDLLEVSTLRPQQIVQGKLASAALQACLYLSAVAPCIAFTYLLRGIDVVTIALLLSYALFASVGLSAMGLLMAVTTRKRQGQVVMSILLTGGLFLAFSMLMGVTTEIMRLTPAEKASEWFVGGHVIVALIYVTTFALVYLATVAHSTFASANRSTPLRIAAVFQQAVFVGSMAALLGYTGSSELVLVAFSVAAVYWYLAGTIMIGEGAVLSTRVQRSLPQSLFARILMTWFNPGPGAGYVFATANLLVLLLLFVAVVVFGRVTNLPFATMDLVWYGVLLWAYVAFYLGLARLVVMGLCRIASLGIVGSFLIGILLPLGGGALPYLLESLTDLLGDVNYPLLQYPSPVWTMTQLVEGGFATTAQRMTMQVTLLATALVMLLVNLALAANEARQLRLAKPKRVVMDDAAQHPGPEALVTNPWGDTTERPAMDDV